MTSKDMYLISCIFANTIRISVLIIIKRLNIGNSNSIIQYLGGIDACLRLINNETEYIITKFNNKFIAMPKYRCNPIVLKVLY